MASRIADDAALVSHVEAVLSGQAKSDTAERWYTELKAFLEHVKAAPDSQWRNREFLNGIWDKNPVAAIGMGTVRMAPALDDAAFVEWFAGKMATDLPNERQEVEAHLTALYNELAERLSALCGRAPRVKINRVLCARYPKYFTTIADVGALRYLHREMGGGVSDHPVRAHLSIRQRLDPLIESRAGSGASPMLPLCVPWMLYERLESGESLQDAPSVAGPEGLLKPMPAELRRKGLTAMKGGFPTLLSLLPPLKDGLTREEFTDLIRQTNPDLAAASISPFINVVSREFDLCKREGNEYQLTARGLNLLESRDPDELADHLLPKVLGIDHVLLAIRDGGPTKIELIKLLQKAHPGWTSDFGPNSLLGWMTSLQLIDLTADRRYKLTERGKHWCSMITWTPELLADQPQAIAEAAGSTGGSNPTKVDLPMFIALQDRLTKRLGASMSFPVGLLQQLHGGLWFHPVRHFAVLSGLSGTGKTQLALQYARALCDEADDQGEQVRVIPVQPGWFDPGPLLGYVNPLQQSSYRSAPFLDLLLRAIDDPSRPYVVILDEMNLSHPEQYFAPVLSAMETRGAIPLHSLPEGTTEIPPFIPYPANLAVIGTLNMDETTHGLSDKVLDRAYTLEFWDIKVGDFPRWQSSTLESTLLQKTRKVLAELSEALAPVRLHFGWRTIDDVLGLLEFAHKSGTLMDHSLDDALYAKILPKMRGESTQRFSDALKRSIEIAAENGLLRCNRKLEQLLKDLQDTGSARFWR